jgi:hypothetical protein
MRDDILTFLSAAVGLVTVWAFVYVIFGLF